MKVISTLRNLFLTCNLMDVYSRLYARHVSVRSVTDGDLNSAHTFESCVDSYRNVIQEMMMKPVKKNTMPLYVSREKEKYSDEDEYYYSVRLLNNKYKSPPEGLKPWYGPVKGMSDSYFNANLNKHNKFFGVFCTAWIELINADVILDQSAIDAKISHEELVAEILWEITFHGFSENAQSKFLDTLRIGVKKAKKSLSKKKK